MFGVNHDGGGDDYWTNEPTTAGVMTSSLGDNSAIFMLFDPATNYHYIMFQMGDESTSDTGSTKFDISFPQITDSSDDASVTTTVGTGDLSVNAATSSGQTGSAD